MTEYTIDLCEGGTTYSESSYNSPDTAFDNSDAAGWISNSHDVVYIGYAFTESKQIEKLTLKSHPLLGYLNQNPTRFQLRAGNSAPTGTVQGTLLFEEDVAPEDEATYWTTVNQLREYTFNNNTSYTHYWIDILDKSGFLGATNEYKIGEIEMMEIVQTGTPYIRPDLVSQFYSASSQGSLRGKAAEGFIRPTIKQFFAPYMRGFEEIANS